MKRLICLRMDNNLWNRKKYIFYHEDHEVGSKIPGAKIFPWKIMTTGFLGGLSVQRQAGEDLEKPREDLISTITEELTIQEKLFIVSVKDGMPQGDPVWGGWESACRQEEALEYRQNESVKA